ncbi:class I SAM-dependent methyltransferase [Candidatus Pristimantibacillus sp. PTI5]|uniref:class I SAM-dependent methyltransferase n=1 Tax=Candidatus Pristimantibacillus sp. PTI5 TaxID=3400422 RepID=UPI003B020C69
MSKPLIDPKTHKDWVSPHSHAWYAQLARLTGKYSYSWNSTLTEPNGESIFTDEVSQMVRGKHVLDIGCGHGEFAMQWSPVAKQIVGIDITNDFVEAGNNANVSNVSFVQANTKNPLPFDAEQFDCAYNRRGPTSAYLDIKRVIRKGGRILALHPGDALNNELPGWFPHFFERHPEGTPIKDHIKERLDRGGCADAEIEAIRSIEYFHEPVDIIRMRCFGQKPSVFEMVLEESLPEMTRIFEKHATEKGLPATLERYIVRVQL